MTIRHKQVLAQVKTLVDSGIKDVVEALTEYKNTEKRKQEKPTRLQPTPEPKELIISQTE